MVSLHLPCPTPRGKNDNLLYKERKQALKRKSARGRALASWSCTHVFRVSSTGHMGSPLEVLPLQFWNRAHCTCVLKGDTQDPTWDGPHRRAM